MTSLVSELADVWPLMHCYKLVIWFRFGMRANPLLSVLEHAIYCFGLGQVSLSIRALLDRFPQYYFAHIWPHSFLDAEFSKKAITRGFEWINEDCVAAVTVERGLAHGDVPSVENVRLA